MNKFLSLFVFVVLAWNSGLRHYMVVQRYNSYSAAALFVQEMNGTGIYQIIKADYDGKI